MAVKQLRHCGYEKDLTSADEDEELVMQSMGRPRDFENVSPAIRTMGPLNNDWWHLFNRLIGTGELVGGAA